MSERRRIAVLTTGRQDFGILRSSLLLLQSDPRFELLLWAGGMHLLPEFGRTIERVREDGFEVAAELDFLRSSVDAAETAGRAVESVAAVLRTQRPEALVVLGDRYETLAAGFAATLEGVPIVHLHGGEETEGAIDNAMRHALTKLSHLHLVSHLDHARRVQQMGEAAEDVIVVGAPGLDNLYRMDLPDRAALAQRLGISLEGRVVLVTLHPTTLGGSPVDEVTAVAEAMSRVDATYVITQPNADAGGQSIRAYWSRWAQGRTRTFVRDALGETNYWALLRECDAVLGNSSSGIIEAPAAGLPVVNVGDRQRGRVRSEHVVDAAPVAADIASALDAALSPERRRLLAAVPGIYPKGPAAPRIVEAIAAWNAPMPPRKRFRDLTFDWAVS